MNDRNWKHMPTGHRLQARLRRIALLLPGFTLGQHDHGIVLCGDLSKVIVIGLTRDDKRLVFHGIYPAPKPRPSWWASGADATITVTIAKPDHVIAAEIQRRLLPAYIDELVDVRRRIHEHEHHRAAREEFLNTLLARLPGSWRVEPGPPHHRDFVRASRWDHPLLSNIEIHPGREGTTADITITAAAGPFLDQILNAAADALQTGRR